MKSLLVLLVFLVSSVSYAYPEYNFFNSWDEASRVFQGVMMENQPSTQKTVRVVPYSRESKKEEYKRVETIVGVLTEKFAELYPGLKLEGQIPHVMLLDDKYMGGTPNAFVIPGYPKSNFFITVTLGILQSDDDVGLAGVLAHELTHLFFIETDENVQSTFATKFYMNPGEALLYEEISPEMEQIGQTNVLRIDALQFYSGPIDEEILGDFPYNPNPKAVSGELVFLYMLRDNFPEKSCQSAYDGWTRFRRRLYALSYSNWTDQEYQELTEGITRLRDSVKKDTTLCLGDKQYSYAEVLSKILRTSEENVIEGLTGNEEQKNIYEGVAKIFEENNAAKALFSSTSLSRQIRRETTKDLRYYNNEDFADEIAIKVLSSLGAPANEFGRYLVKLFSSEAVYSQCLSQVDEQQQEPWYGHILNIHHSPCWRYWRSVNISDKVSRESFISEMPELTNPH